MVVCRVCGRMVSRRCNNGIHHTCLARELTGPVRADVAAHGDRTQVDGLPSLTDICLARIETREFIGVGILPQVEREFNKCIANVVAFSRPDAWAHIGTQQDSEAHQRARTAWIEWFMFAKTVLLVLPGGRAKEKRNDNILANRIARWAEGERSTLWREAMKISKADKPPAAQKRKHRTEDEELEAKRQQVVDLARRGLPGKAVRHASSQGLAPDTRATEATMRSKFVTPPVAQASSRRMPAPEANEITEDAVVRAIRSFDAGVAAGPSGQRPDFFKQLIGENGDKHSVPLITGLANLLASGRAPPELRPYIGGAKGTALFKVAKDGSDDARPACSGETVRRVVGKALLASEMKSLKEHVLPHQLAVGVQAGVEGMPHVVRQWRDDNADDPDKVLINFDEGNAHNEVDRHTFLTRMRELAPGLSKWLEYVYPTDVATFVFYRGRVIESKAGGQQGCPLIGVCHAVVKRMIHESLGLAPPLAASSVHLPRIDTPVELDIAPLFADDGVIAGKSAEVLRALRHMQTVMPSVGLRFSQLQIAAASYAPQPPERFSLFVAAGCTPVLDGNLEVLKSPLGTTEFCRTYCQKVADRQRGILTFLSELGDAQVSHYLMRWCVNGSRMNYMVRTTPPTLTCAAAAAFDDSVTGCMGAICGIHLTESQRLQSRFGIREGGLGVRSVGDRADAAYIASRAMTHEVCKAIRPQHGWIGADTDQHLQAAVDSLRPKLADASLLDGELTAITQSILNEEVDKWNVRAWRGNANPTGCVRLNAYTARGAGRELEVTPSTTLDTHLKQVEFATAVATRLGVDVMEGDHPCGFCGQLMDAGGLHVRSCMAGGEHTTQHNAVRDIYYDYCERGRLRPRSEAPRVLAEVLGVGDRRRPADVLCIPALPLARVLPDGARAIRTEPVCFDFAIVNALGPSHWGQTAVEPGLAAEEYASYKRRDRGTEDACLQAGYRFWPVIHESQGGTSKSADAALRAIATAVAEVENRDAGKVREEMLGRIAVVLARSASRAICRRGVKGKRARPSWAAAVVASCRETEEASDAEA